MVSEEFLVENAHRLHTTERGAERIGRNLRIDPADAVGWCRARILDPDAVIVRRGKNWYAVGGGCRITVNARSYTIITAHTLGGGRERGRGRSGEQE